MWFPSITAIICLVNISILLRQLPRYRQWRINHLEVRIAEAKARVSHYAFVAIGQSGDAGWILMQDINALQGVIARLETRLTQLRRTTHP